MIPFARFTIVSISSFEQVVFSQLFINETMEMSILGTKYPPFVVFSVYTNGKKLFTCVDTGPSSGTIQCIEGIRVLSLMWIVSFHIYRRYGLMPLRETETFKEVIWLF